MKVMPFVHEGLGNSSYLVDLGEGQALVVDPDRSIQRYLQLAEARGLRIVALLETHLHADFVSGARELAHATGARILLPAGEQAKFPHEAIEAGQRLRLASADIEALASPGHTPEHLAYVLRSARQPPQLFSGGALIVGGAARTDLISPDLTESLTRSLFHTVHQVFAALPDNTILYPTHGGGSFCSTGAGGERISTLGRERASNPLLRQTEQEEFVRWLPRTFPAAPDYFFRLRAFNQAGPRLRGEIPSPRPLSADEFAEALAAGAIVIDVRSKEEYSLAHVPNAISNPLRDVYATWLGWLVPPDLPLLFVTDGVRLEDVVAESLLVGYERFVGWLQGGITAWQASGRPVAEVRLVDAQAARRAIVDGAEILDVRESDEFASGHIEGALQLPLGRLQDVAATLPKGRPLVAYCGHGERASTAASLLERAGLGPLLNLDGGIEAWRAAGYPIFTNGS